jgi:alpha-L-rhamnosidase
LPELYLVWQEFLSGGYDTIGENGGAGTHAHGWNCTPSRDMRVYTLGVTPAEPGLTQAHIAPRLGRLEWVKGSLPTPSGALTL